MAAEDAVAVVDEEELEAAVEEDEEVGSGALGEEEEAEVAVADLE